MNPRIIALGEAALTLEFGDNIDAGTNARVMAARAALADMKLDGISDLVPTYRSLTVHFDPLRLERQVLSKCLLQAAQAPPQEAALATRWLLPVAFGDEFGPDLAEVEKTTRRSEAEIIEALCTTELRVFLIGFLPGFPYLGELPEWLRLPRRATPRTAVPANSLAIAGAQAAVYPWQSPGGWHLLGRTPARLFDVDDAARPALLAPGDSVKFRAVSRDEFQRLAAETEAGRIGRTDWQAA
jgi:KipI family sensor histidine kinase inhibitor